MSVGGVGGTGRGGLRLAELRSENEAGGAARMERGPRALRLGLLWREDWRVWWGLGSRGRVGVQLVRFCGAKMEGLQMGCRTRAVRICEGEGWGVPLDFGLRWLETILAPAFALTWSKRSSVQCRSRWAEQTRGSGVIVGDRGQRGESKCVGGEGYQESRREERPLTAL